MKVSRYILFSGVLGAFIFVLLFFLGDREKVFQNKCELIAYVEGPEGRLSDLWRGTFYCGADEKFRYFSHKRELLGTILLIIPKTPEWSGDDLVYTKNSEMWIAWRELHFNCDAKFKD